MSHTNTGPSFNVWQGYVSSISGLLIALLMLMGILAMATAVIQGAVEKGLIAEQAAVKDCQLLADCQKAFVANAGPASAEAESAVHVLKDALADQKISGSRGHRFEIQFPEKVDNGNLWVAEIQKSLKSHTRLKNAVWHIYTVSDPADNQALKNAYVRNLTVREALLQSGVKPEQIETFIDSEQASNTALKKSAVALTVFFN
jgi:hypothetical protein